MNGCNGLPDRRRAGGGNCRRRRCRTSPKHFVEITISTAVVRRWRCSLVHGPLLDGPLHIFPRFLRLLLDSLSTQNGREMRIFDL
jgi:hypothetical protein